MIRRGLLVGLLTVGAIASIALFAKDPMFGWKKEDVIGLYKGQPQECTPAPTDCKKDCRETCRFITRDQLAVVIEFRDGKAVSSKIIGEGGRVAKAGLSTREKWMKAATIITAVADTAYVAKICHDVRNKPIILMTGGDWETLRECAVLGF